ncbi:hypothetical protein PtA15_17A152 [Puccinia triticina]|uniref:CWF21 domain-containing protein n=1 Tax=Puccinia triticina TaxID=208348 RepID=A0ABY7D715_9BASI|nr:uncharacterized protein PtA15_17A152 [Puccinia triticina]WAQ92670.1 hypothetical protein PtA15_17A152 [Puccinia triticina]
MAGNIPLPDAPASPSSSAHKPAHRSRTTNAGCDHPGPATHPIWPEYLAGTLPDPQRTRAESGYPPDRPHQPTAQLPSRQFIEIRIAQLEKERIDVENELSESSKERPEQIGHLRNQARLASIEYHDIGANRAENSNGRARTKENGDGGEFRTRAENKSLRENEIRKVDEVKGLFMRGNIE